MMEILSFTIYKSFSIVYYIICELKPFPKKTGIWKTKEEIYNFVDFLVMIRLLVFFLRIAKGLLRNWKRWSEKSLKIKDGF